MKITKQYLTQVIKEELNKVLNEFSQNSPVRKKMPGGFDFGEAGGIDNIPDGGQARQIDADYETLIGQNANPTTAAKTMEKYGSYSTGVYIPEALALYVIASKHKASGTEEGNKVWSAFKNNIEGRTKDGGEFRALDYLTTGAGNDNRKKLEELYPKLFAQMAKKDQPYRY